MYLLRFTPLILLASIVISHNSTAQSARIYEEGLTMETYGFSDPNPVPEPGRFYPYFKFDGFTAVSKPQSWKMVVLENDYIKVYVSPQIGGKVWGAIEKSTGNAFVYFNHTVKFRSVAMRGPWTSGGVEFNFGTIGHTPNVATPVDYKMQKHEDGSVSCTVGSYDLTSRTRWSVEIRLDPDDAYFSTNARWFNLSEIPTSYYHWTNAAAKAAGNLEFLYPGTNYVGHGGEVGSWPDENGRNIAFYEQNNFGTYKSYHILNTYTDFFGGYWHDDDFGFGHWTSYDEKPGKKLWIWGLSRQGMVWEDLLTDRDGQYIEWQSGKLFNQAAESSTKTPFKHKTFVPGDTDRMYEKWFPLLNIGGADVVTENLVINILKEQGKTTFKLMALENVKEKLTVLQGKNELKSFSINLKPLEITTFTMDAKVQDFILMTDSQGEIYSSNPRNQRLERPLEIDEKFNWDNAYGKYVQATELEAQRQYTEALPLYRQVLEAMPSFTPAYAKLAMAHYRRTEWDEALRYAKTALSHDTYHPEANYVYGLVNAQLQQIDDAKSGFAVAAMDGNFRSVSYLGLAKLAMLKRNYQAALRHTEKSIAGNQENLLGWQLKAILLRKLGRDNEYREVLKYIDKLDPTYAFVPFERHFTSGTSEKFDLEAMGITNELPNETLIELALTYVHCGLLEEAIACLETGDSHPIIAYWLSYLYHLKGDNQKETAHLNRALDASPNMIFPFRPETLLALTHASKNKDHWKTQYYTALIYAQLGRNEKAKKLLADVEEQADFAAFYLFRHKFMANEDPGDIDKALDLAPADWRVRLAAAKSADVKKAAEKHVNKAYTLNPGNPELILARAKIYFERKNYKGGFEFLKKQQLIPYEGANEGREIYYENSLLAALEAVKKKKWREALHYAQMSKLWPENLGAGRPYFVDERISDFLLAYVHEKMGQAAQSKEHYKKVVNFSHQKEDNEALLAQLLAAQRSDNADKLQALLDKYQNSQHEAIQWVLAKFNGKPNPSKGDVQSFDKDFLSELITVITP